MPRASVEQAKTRNMKMVKNIMKGMPQGRAYAKSRDKEYKGNSDMIMANINLKKPEVQQMLQAMRNRFLQDAAKAYLKGWETADDETTPPHVKLKWFESVLDRAGLGSVDLNLHKHEVTHKYEDLVMTKEEIIDIMDEPETAAEISKRNRYD